MRFAWAGLVCGLRSESSLRIQTIAFAAVLVALLIFRPEPLWWALTLLASAGVIAAELFNTAIESLVDHLHPEIHPNIRMVKDCAAAAVLVASAGALAVGIALAVHMLSR